MPESLSRRPRKYWAEWQVSWLTPKRTPSHQRVHVFYMLLSDSGFAVLSKKELTVAGTAQVSHLIPFYTCVENNRYHQFLPLSPDTIRKMVQR